MEQVDRDRILERYEGIEEFREVVGIYEFAIEDCPITLKIKVKRMKGVWYQGVANYGIAHPPTDKPYRSIKLKPSVQEALEDALTGFMSSWKPEWKDETRFELDKDW